MRKEPEVVSGRSDGQQASLGDFAPQTLAYLGKRHQRRLWAVAVLRNQTYRQNRICLPVDPMRPRESFALAWLLLLSGLSAMRLQATAYLRALYRNRA